MEQNQHIPIQTTNNGEPKTINDFLANKETYATGPNGAALVQQLEQGSEGGLNYHDGASKAAHDLGSEAIRAAEEPHT